ncbi:monoamine oxidase [Caulobacter ginsengisoli]|uniref:Tryptophan 2-monooxygenase n=1 Tax=Caulobacter ginsengisoli TaxID=400775 RepID=A0ABU0IY24_9CAUL|nr:NAD(P)/FAD-dependent oxidoreductase [Caulobacter ginsengisoli]MDQ0466231.1 monoamine oxidase [Caulobacter ginsengisoli]
MTNLTNSLHEAPFSLDAAFAFPRDIGSHDVPGARKKICIVGGGVAGLVGAYELEKLGHTVTIYEASDRTGGRIRTHRFPDGTYGELGAMRLPANHACTLHYIRELDLKTRPFVNHNPNAFYLIRGERVKIRHFPVVTSRFDVLPNEQRDPLRVFEDTMKVAMASLTTPDKWEMFGSNLKSERTREYDEISLRQYLRMVGLSEEAVEYIGHCTGMIQYERASFLETLIDYFGLFRVDQLEIIGGMDLLVSRLVSEISGKIHLGTLVRRIEIDDKGVFVYSSSQGNPQKERFDYVLCTAPAAPTARIQFSPPLPWTKARALNGLSYASAAKTLVHAKRRFWELDDEIFGGGSFSDLPFQQCWYPSDNAAVASEDYRAGYTGSEAEEESISHAPRLWKGKSSAVSRSPGVLTASYAWETNARRLASLPTNEREMDVLQGIEALHPGRVNLIDDIVHIAWDDGGSPGGGAFAYFAPGEHYRYQAALTDPHPAVSPRVFFAGEHISVAHAWIQGAIQTALIGVKGILSAAPPSSSLENM